MKLRIQSIFAKIVLWFLATVVLSLIGLVITSEVISAQFSGRDTTLLRVQAMVLDDARRAYETGGSGRLDGYLLRLRAYSEGTYYLTDARGIDLVSGEDRSGLRSRRPAISRSLLGRWLPRSGPAVRMRVSDDGRYRLISVVPVPPRVNPANWLWYFLWFPFLIAALCYVLAVHLASPLREIRRVVERFGRGDLTSRIHLRRRDEIGELGRSFNHMAGQITTLLSAERRLLQDVSHELRSPLARLGFAVELARTSPDREAALARVRKEADRLHQLVNELMQLTTAEGDPSARNLETVALGELLRELVTECTLEAEAQQCELVIRSEQPAVVSGDRELLRRACDNVLTNAIRHAPAGSSVDIDLTTHDSVASIAIRDHGPGVPAESLGALFKPFYRVENDRGRSSGGVGLGLAIARRAIELHQGRITARNAEPGLIIEIELPVEA
jgi:two-component system sensor histidine kinase CpxA